MKIISPNYLSLQSSCSFRLYSFVFSVATYSGILFLSGLMSPHLVGQNY